MTTFFVALAVVLVLVAGMAVGVLMGREPIKGSCGGIAALGIDTECEICGGNPHLCETEQQNISQSAEAGDLSYDATKC
jgi:hypothetical protein